MKNSPVVVIVVLLILCILYIATKIIHNEKIPSFLFGFAGALCGILIHCISDKNR